MRKFVALALAMLMMLALIPTAFAAIGDVAKVEKTTYTYYAPDNTNKPNDALSDPDEVTHTADGGTAYIQTKYATFLNWQIPGNALTGNALSWNKWVRIDAQISLKGYANGSVVYIDGYPYTVTGGVINVTFYVLPVEGGVTINKALQIWDSNNSNSKLIDRANVSFIYEDMYTPKGTVTTEGINQANTYAYIEDGAIQVDVVYANLQAVMVSTNPTSGSYLAPDYYPVRVKLQLLDKDGNKFPAFTRADILNNNEFNDVTVVINNVPNFVSVFYLDANSEVTLEKRFLPGSKSTATNVKQLVYDEYFKAAVAQQASTATAYSTVLAAIQTLYGSANLTGTADLLNLIDNGIRENSLLAYVKGQIAAKYVTDWEAIAVTGTGGNAFAYATTQATDYAVPTDDAETEDPNGVTSKYAKNLQAFVKATIDFFSTKTNYVIDDTSSTAPADVDENEVAFDAAMLALNPILSITTPADQATALSVFVGSVNSSLVDATTKTARSKAKYDEALAALKYYQVTAAGVVSAVATIRNTSYDYINDNANLFNSELDSLELRLTDPVTNAMSTQTLTIQYNSVSRITSKGLTSLQGTSVSLTVGATQDVTVNATQNGVPVTGLPIKFVSNDPAIATATSPNTQAINTNTTTITGIKAGTTFVKAYLDTANDPAECYIMVTVTDPAPVVPEAPTTTDYVCKVRKLWVRSGAGTSNEKVGYYSRNDVAKVYEVVDGWAKVDYNGSIAYSSTGNGKYLAPK